MANTNKSGITVSLHNIVTEEIIAAGVTNSEGVVTIAEVPRGDWEVILVMPSGYLYNSGNTENDIIDGNDLDNDLSALPVVVEVRKNLSSSITIVLTQKIYTLVVTFVTNGYSFKITRPTDVDSEVIMYIQSEIPSLPAPPSGHPKQSVLTILTGQVESNVITVDDYVASSVDGFGLRFKLYDPHSNLDIAVTIDGQSVLNEENYISY